MTMRIAMRQKELRITERALMEKSGVSRATIYRAKRPEQTGGVKRRGPMEQLAKALKLEIVDIDEFRPALRERMFREAERRGAPQEVRDEVEQMQEVFKVDSPDEKIVVLGAYALVRKAVAYLDRIGRADLVDKTIEKRNRRRGER